MRNHEQSHITNQATKPGFKILSSRLTQRLLLTIAFLIVALIAAAIVTRSPGLTQSNRNVWDYKIALQWDENELMRLGADGWELVAVDASRGDVPRAFFKRPRH